MNKVLLDSATRASLNGLDSHLELCDDAGRTLGFFVPSNGESPSKSGGDTAALSAECQSLRQRVKELEKEKYRILIAWSRERVPDEELARLKENGELGRPLHDFLKELGAL